LRSTEAVHGPLLDGDGGDGLDGGSQHDVLSAGYSGQDSSRVVGREPGCQHGVVVFAPEHAAGRETCPDLDALDRSHAHERCGHAGVKLVKDRLSEARWDSAGADLDDAAQGVAQGRDLPDPFLPALDRAVVGREEGSVSGTLQICAFGRDASKLHRGGPDGNPQRLQKGRRHGSAGHAGHGLPPRGAASATIVAQAVLGLVGHVPVARAENVLEFTVIPGALVGIFDDKANGGACGAAFEESGQKADTVRFIAGGDGLAALAGPALVKLCLNRPRPERFRQDIRPPPRPGPGREIRRSSSV
jgi:hypothetical protein